jgi:DNA-binding GntR family transcriptional regulator
MTPDFAALFAPIEAAERGERTPLVVAALRDAILSGQIEAGSILREELIASALRVSRGPVREALGILEDEGLVLRQPKRATIVPEITSEEDIREISLLNGELHSLVIALAAPHLTPEDLDALDHAAARMSAAAARNDRRDFLYWDDQFHEILLDAGKFRLLERILQIVEARWMAIFVTRMRVTDVDLTLSARLHLQMADALRRGKVDLAQMLCKHHIFDTADALLAALPKAPATNQDGHAAR